MGEMENRVGRWWLWWMEEMVEATTEDYTVQRFRRRRREGR